MNLILDYLIEESPKELVEKLNLLLDEIKIVSIVQVGSRSCAYFLYKQTKKDIKDGSKTRIGS